MKHGGDGEMKNTTGEPLLVVQSAIQRRTLSIAGAFALPCAVELGIPDRIHAYGCQPMPLAALALSISVPPEKHPMLRRLMHLLSAQGVFALQALGDGYLLTPLSRLLVDDGSPNISAYVRALLTPDLVKPWHCMSEWLTQAGGASSKAAFETAHGGKSFWDVARERPEVGRLFDEAMVCESRRTGAAVAACCPHVFRGIGTLVDVGGGNGTTARLVAEAFPQVKCTVLDLPHVVAAAPKCELFDAVGGDMFQHIPPADAVRLK
ncbi:Eugenol O-methyltransferase, partial [Ananas comosus]